MYIITNELLTSNGINVNNRELKLQLLSHPEFPYLKSVTDTLDYFSIDSVVASVPKSSIPQLPENFIAQVFDGIKESLVHVSKVSNDKLFVKVNNKISQTITQEQFLRSWTGLIIAIDKNPNQQQKTKIKNLVGFSCLLIIALFSIQYIFSQTGSVLSITYFISSLIGLSISILIISEKIFTNSFASKICSFSKDTDCGIVLNSDKAKLFNVIDLGDASIIYFSFVSLAFLIDQNNISFFIISILSLPVVAYSLFHQSYSIGKLCPLCLGIALVLSLQFLIMINQYELLSVNYNSISFTVMVLIGVVSGWFYVKPLLIIEKKQEALIIENLAFRRNHKLFIPFYNSQNKVAVSSRSIDPIKLGSVDSQLILTIVTNPVCKMCRQVHTSYMELLKKYPNKIQIHIVFLAPFKNRNDVTTQVSERILELYLSKDKTQFYEAFDECYSDIDMFTWQEKWGLATTNFHNNALSEYAKWCFNNNISGTPELLINDKMFPKVYLPSDIEHFIDSLLYSKNENVEIKNTTIHV